MKDLIYNTIPWLLKDFREQLKARDKQAWALLIVWCLWVLVLIWCGVLIVWS